ncbi:MAG TPA: FeoA domain-containing protein [Steroidobacteraceae bacterium]|jgi:Fe2+ transport system protein FeoA|nr:FeoA domain-containing protein [Steroidobacteraceae bacterium]
MNAQPARPLVQSLAHLHKGMRGRVSGVIEQTSPAGHAPAHDAAATIGDAAGSTIARRLIELGFVAGEAVEIIEEARPGGDPIAVRIGSSIFALRRREAQVVMVQVDPV